MPFPYRESHPGSGSALIQSLVLNKMSPAKDTNLTEAPRVLALHLKRFVWAPQCVSVSVCRHRFSFGSRLVGPLRLARKVTSR